MTSSKEKRSIRTNVGPARTTFFGREAELDRITEGFSNGAGLVTIVGPPGAGKTRLAVEYARKVIADASAEAVWVFDLSPTSKLADAVVRVAEVLDVPLGRSVDQSVEAFLDALRTTGRTVLVFDNFEHLADVDGALIAAWVTTLPDSRVMVTSQIRIGAPDELCIELGPLETEAATALFDERARAVRHGFRLDADEESVLRLLDHLDNLPLAIELAAARTNTFGVEDMLERMDARFELLERGGVTASGRHATLEAAIDWAWELLEEEERIALECCGLFDRGFWIAAAEAVVRQVAADADVDSAVASLRERSLIFAAEVPGAEGRLRLRLYESIREFARARLDEGPRREAAEAAYIDYYANRAREWLAAAPTATAADLTDVLSDRENLVNGARLALRTNPEAAVALVAGIQDLDERRGPLGQHADLVEALVDALAEKLPPGAMPRLAAAHLLGRLRYAEGRIDDGKAVLSEALEHAVLRGKPWIVARCAFVLGSLHLAAGDIALALSRFEQAAEAAIAIEDEVFHSQAQERTGAMHSIRGEFDLARDALDAAIFVQSRGGFADEEAFTRMTYVNLCVGQGLMSEASAHAEKAVALYQHVGNTRGEAEALTLAALVATELGRLDDGDRFVEEALVLHRRVTHRQSLGTALLFRGRLRQEQGRLDDAEADLREAFDLHRTSYSRPAAFDRCHLGLVLLERGDAVGAEAEIDRGVAALKSMGDPVFAGRFARALAMTRFMRGLDTAAAEVWDKAKSEAPAEREPLVAALDAAVSAVADVAAARRAHVERRADDVAPQLDEARSALIGIDHHLRESSSFIRAAIRIANRAIERAAVLVVAPRAPAPKPREPRQTANVLRVAADSSWFEFASLDRVHIARRRSMRGILGALVRKRMDTPGVGLSRDDVFDAGWPREQVIEEAARSRVYVAIRTLRTLGLEDVLDTGSQGYLIRATVEVEIV